LLAPSPMRRMLALAALLLSPPLPHYLWRIVALSQDLLLSAILCGSQQRGPLSNTSVVTPPSSPSSLKTIHPQTTPADTHENKLCCLPACLPACLHWPVCSALPLISHLARPCGQPTHLAYPAVRAERLRARLYASTEEQPHSLSDVYHKIKALCVSIREGERAQACFRRRVPAVGTAH
jgi:hypothetical protein